MSKSGSASGSDIQPLRIYNVTNHFKQVYHVAYMEKCLRDFVIPSRHGESLSLTMVGVHTQLRGILVPPSILVRFPAVALFGRQTEQIFM